jgi:hypothetical protein
VLIASYFVEGLPGCSGGVEVDWWMSGDILAADFRLTSVGPTNLNPLLLKCSKIDSRMRKIQTQKQ